MDKFIKHVLVCCVLMPVSFFAMDLSLRNEQFASKQLLEAICNGPKPEDHIFCEARFVSVSEDNPFNATVKNSSEDVMSRSVMEFGSTCLEPVLETPTTCVPFKRHSVLQSLRCAGTLALVCVHGTYSQHIGFGDNLERKSTHAIIDLAHTLGLS